LCVVLERVLLSFCYTRCPLFPARLIEEAVFFPQCNLTSFVKDKLPKGSWVYLWYFYLVLLVYISVFVSVSYCLDDHSFIVYFEVRKVESSSFVFLFFYFSVFFFFFPFFFLKVALPILCVCIQIVTMFCSSSGMYAIGNLIEIALGLEIVWGSIFIFTKLILPTQEHGISLHLFVLSLIFFISVLYFLHIDLCLFR